MKKHILVFLTVLFSNPLLLLSFNVEAATEEVVVNITSVFDADNQTSTTATGSFGDKLSVTPALQSGYEFVYWVVNGVVRPSLPLNHEFTIQSIMNLQAVFAKTGEKAVLFVDSNGALLKTEYLLEGQINVSDPYETFLVKPTKPGLIVKTVDRWLSHNGATLDNISNHTVFRLQYESDITKPLNLTVSGGFIKLNAEKLFNEVTIVEPVVPEGKVFSHWLKDGNLVSYEPVYAFTLIKDTALEAVFADEAPTKQPLLVMSDDMGIRGDMHTFISQFELPNEVEIVEMGYLLHKVDTQELTIDTVGVNRILINNYAISTNEFVLSFLKNEFHSLRSYLIYNDGTNLVTIYSNSLINKYEVTYYDEDGVTVLETLNVDYNETPVPTVTPTKAATLEYTYTFNEWVMLDSLNYKASYSATPVNYIITWIVDGVETVETLPYGSAIPEREDPSKTGYNFTGWEMTVPATMPAKDLLLTAQFTLIDYTITYHLDGGTNNGSNPNTYTIESSTIYLQNATKTGYLFTGWYLESTLTTKVSEIPQGSTENVVLYAAYAQNVGVFSTNTAPAWVKGYESQVKNKFETAYLEAGFTATPSATIVSTDLGKARVMLHQIIDNQGIIFLNERDGNAFYTTNINVKTANGWMFEDDETHLLLGIIRDERGEFFVSDDGVYQIEATTRTRLTYTVGRGETSESYVGFWDITLNDFNKAYKFSENYMSSLGLPTSFAYSRVYNTYDLKSNGTYKEGKPKSDKRYVVQQFEHGWIIQARGRLEDEFAHYAVQHGAAPILNDMYALVTSYTGNSNLNITGAPVSIEFTYNGIRYQNFEYGYGKIVNGVFSFTSDLVVDVFGTEMSRIIGAGEHFDNWRKGVNHTGGYELTWERLRVGQDFRNVVGKMIRDNRKPYNSEGGIHHTIHELDGMGVVQIFKDGTGATIGWGNSFVVQGPWWAGAHEIAPELNAFALANKDTLGRPIKDWTKVGSTISQVFERGIVEKVGSAEPVIK